MSIRTHRLWVVPYLIQTLIFLVNYQRTRTSSVNLPAVNISTQNLVGASTTIF